MKGFILLTIIGVAIAAPSTRSGKPCLCELLVGEIRELATAEHSQEQLLDYVSEVCSHLEGEEKDTCRTMLYRHGGDMVDVVTSHLTPEEVCNLLPDVCDGLEEITPVLQLPPVQKVVQLEEEPKGALECELCKLLVLGVDKLIGQNKSAKAINETLEKLCDSLPEQIQPLCQEIEPKLLEVLEQGLNPDEACSKIGVCLSGLEEFHLPCDTCLTALDAIGIQEPHSLCMSLGSCDEPVVEEPEPKTNTFEEPMYYPAVEETMQEPTDNRAEENVEGALECQLCKFLVNAIDKLVGENKTVSSINATLYEVCNDLPGELKDACLNIEPEILKAILGGIDPTMACDFVKACSGSSPVALTCDACKETMDDLVGQKGIAMCYAVQGICAEDKTEVAPVELGDDTECDICKFIVSLLDEVFEGNATIPKVNETLFEICKALPSTYKLLCYSLIPKIELIIEHGFDPKNACIAVKLCEMNTVPVNFPTLTCDGCNKVVERVIVDNKVGQVGHVLCGDMCSAHRRRRSIADNMERWQSIASTIQQAVTGGKQDAGFLECEVCRIMIRLVDEIAGQNASMQTVNNTLEEICTRLTGDQLIDMCLQEVPKLMVFMKAGIQPDQVCKAASMCDSVVAEDEAPSFTDILYNKGIKEAGKTDEPNDLKCDLCKELVQFVDTKIGDNATDAKINETLYRICSGLPAGLSDLCMQEIPAIMKTVESGGFDPTKACDAAHLCDEVVAEDEAPSFTDILYNKGIKEAGKTDEPNDLKCDLCKELVQFVDTKIGDNATDAKINETLYRICSGLPAGLSDLCMQEIPAIMKTVESGGFDPTKACDAAHLCDEGIETEDISVNLEPEQEKMDEPNDLKCDLCKELVQFVDTKIADNATDAKINETLYRICSGLPSGLSDLCMQEIPAIMKTVESGGFDPTKACDAAHLCDEGMGNKKLETNLLAQVVGTEKTGGNLKDLKCELCEAVIDEIDNKVGQNASIAKINETIYNLCNDLPSELKGLCMQVAPQVVKAISEGVDYKVVCSKIGLCPSQQGYEKDAKDEIKNLEQIVEKMEEPNDFACDLCKELVRFVDGQMDGQNETDAKINETLYRICSGLPSGLSDLCMQQIPAIMKTVENGGFDPKKACDVAHLCEKATNILSQEPEKKIKGNVKDLKCEICEAVIDEIDSLVGQNASIAKINETIYDLCNKLPGALQDVCKQVAPQVVREIAMGVNHTIVCAKIGLCSSIRQAPSVVYEDEAAEPVEQEQEEGSALVEEFVQPLLCEDSPSVVYEDEPVEQEQEEGSALVEEFVQPLLCEDSPSVVYEDEPVEQEQEEGSALVEELVQPLLCDACVKTVSTLYSTMQSDYPKVQPSLAGLCDHLPEKYRYTCGLFVDADKGLYFKKFLEKVNPEVLCDAIQCQ